MTTTDNQPDTTDGDYRQRAGSLAAMLTLRPERHDQRMFGKPAPANECGTSACVAGWADLWATGVVNIAVDGVMTWDPSALGVFTSDLDAAEDLYGLSADEVASSRTLVRMDRDDTADQTMNTIAENARDWLGLGGDMANALFYRTSWMGKGTRNAVAVEVLRWIADGRLSRDAELSTYDLRVMTDALRETQGP